jgi:hypothetical protein
MLLVLEVLAVLFVLGFRGENVERETGFEPATNSLEGCDSTPELLPRIEEGMVEADGFEPP